MAKKEITCPKCGSDQLSANKKGFGVGKAVAGAVLTGGVGLLAGFIGSRKIYVTCLACGHQWTILTEHARRAKAEQERRFNEGPLTWGCVFEGVSLLLFFTLIAYLLITCGKNGHLAFC